MVTQKINKSYILAIASIIVMVSFCIWFFFIRIDKVVYVDANRILMEYNGAKEAREALEKKMEQWQLNIDTLNQDLQTSILDLEENANSSSSETIRKTIRQKQKTLADYRQAIQQNALQEDQKLTQNVLTNINQFLKQYGQKKRLKYILVANQAGGIAYAEEALDITDEIINRLNDAYGTSKK